VHSLKTNLCRRPVSQANGIFEVVRSRCYAQHTATGGL